MKKKIKDLTKEECDKICAFHNKKGTSCLNDYAQNIKCPLWFANSCLKGFIEKIQYIEREVEIDEINFN